MISHKYRCILIHIPRTGGSSIERWIHGQDWWNTSPETKHLLASQAKRVYREYWDDYFKFAFVRNPWDRTVSCLHHAAHFGLRSEEDTTEFHWMWRRTIDLAGYKEMFGYPVTLEYDYRFYERSELLTTDHQPNCVYGNILDEPIDFIGRFETLKADTRLIQRKIGIKDSFGVHKQKSKRRKYTRYYDENTRDDVRQLYAGDIEAFGYRYASSSLQTIG